MRKSETFTALNGLRFLAALAVVLFHYAPRTSGYALVPAIVRNLIDEGPAAVGFFFILSGFVLAHRHLQSDSRVETPGAFYWARFIRLYPAYLLSFALFLPVAVQLYILNPRSSLSGRHTFIFSGVLSCLMLQSWTPLAQAWNGPSWSLSVEAFMYLLFPFIGPRLAKLTLRKTLFVLLLSWLIPSGLACAYQWRWIPGPAWHAYITNNPLLWLPLFVIGICATRALPAWRRLTSRTANLISTSAVAALILAALFWPHAGADIFVTAGIAPLLLAVTICFTRLSSPIARLIGGRLLNRLGEVSYVIYIIQAPAWHYWQLSTNFLRRLSGPTNLVATWQFIAFVPFLVSVSLAVQRFVETPLRAWLGNCSTNNLIARARPRPALPAESQLVG